MIKDGTRERNAPCLPSPNLMITYCHGLRPSIPLHAFLLPCTTAERWL